MRPKALIRHLVPFFFLLFCLVSFSIPAGAVSFSVEEFSPPSEILTADVLRRMLPETEIPFRGELTRGEFCYCLNARLSEADQMLPQRSSGSIPDVDIITKYCRDIEHIVHGGVMGCNADGLFCPTEPITVGEAELCLQRLNILAAVRKNDQPASTLPPHKASGTDVLDSACMLGHSNALGFSRCEKTGMDCFALNGITAEKYISSHNLILPEFHRGSYLTGLEQGNYLYVYIMLGTNDVHYGPAELPAYMDSLREIVDNVQRLQPEASICFLSLTPLGFNAKSIPEYHRQEYIRAYNEALKTLSRECGSAYLDLFTPLCGRDGYNRAGLALPDGIHYSQSGYDLILQILLTYFPEEAAHD